MKLFIKSMGLLAMATLLNTSPAKAGTHTWSGAVNFAWSNDGNWSAGGAPQFGESNIVLVFPAVAVRYAATNGVGNYAIDDIIINGNNYTLGGYAITLTGASYYNLECTGDNNRIAMDITMSSALEYFNVGSSAFLRIDGTLSGNGGFKKFGPGRLMLSGGNHNNYSYATTVVGGYLDLNKPPGIVAVPGLLTVGTSVSVARDSYVRWYNSDQIPDATVPTVNATGELLLMNASETVGGLLLQGGWVDAPAGVLTLKGNLNAMTVMISGSAATPGVSGQLSLGGATRTFQVDGGFSSDCIIMSSIADGGGAAGITKIGSGGLSLWGVNSFSGETKVNEGHLDVGGNASLGSSAAGTTVASGANLWIDNGVHVVGEPITISGNGDGGFGALRMDNGASLGGNIVLTGDTQIGVYDSNATAIISGAISGPGALHKIGDGVLQLSGLTVNTYAGGSYLDEGSMALGKWPGFTAVPGAFYIGKTNVAANSNYIAKTNQVRLLSSQQIADNSPIVMQASALLDLNGFNESIGPLMMAGAYITNSGGGVLTLNGDVAISSPWNNFPEIFADVSLGGTDRVFTTLNEGGLSLDGVVTDGGAPAGIIKMGTHGGILLEGTNSTYAGVTHVKEGWLSASQPGSLGLTSGGVTVESNAMFELAFTFHGPVGTLTLKDQSQFASVGNNSWDGNVVLNGEALIYVDPAANNESLDITGPISGPGGLTFVYGGTLRLGGGANNTYTGRTKVIGSTLWNRVTALELGKTNGAIAIPAQLNVGVSTNPPNNAVVRMMQSNQIADNAGVMLDNSGLLAFDMFNAQAETIGSLGGSGNVSLIFATLTTGGNNQDSTFSGTISGVGFTPLIKEGTGSMTLKGTNTCSGKMIVNNGHLYANGSQTAGVQLNANGALHGQGTVGNITGLGGWTIPGDNLSNPVHGALSSGNLTLDPTSDFNVDLGGPATSGKYDRIKVTGSVTLSNATLHLTQSAMAKTNDQFVIIENDGVDAVQGTFAGLTNNAVFVLGQSQTFKITYNGGDGNDVVLTQLTIPPAPSMGGITNVGNGQIQITGSGVPGWVYAVEATETIGDANSWQPVGSATADQNGKLVFVDPDANKHAMRFYRFKAP